MSQAGRETYLESLERVAEQVIRPAAAQVDEAGSFPSQGMKALADNGLLGLISAAEVGGSGQGLRAAVLAIERLARECGSTAMVLCMHYAGTAVIEAHGPRRVREEIAAGRHLTTLAFSESGSRSHFWTPVSTAVAHNGSVQLDARKSWITSAGMADSYVWSSRPLEAPGASTLWLVPARAPGLSSPAPFNGLGLRGNASSPVAARQVAVRARRHAGPGRRRLRGDDVHRPALFSADECRLFGGHDGGRYQQGGCACIRHPIRAPGVSP